MSVTQCEHFQRCVIFDTTKSTKNDKRTTTLQPHTAAAVFIAAAIQPISNTTMCHMFSVVCDYHYYCCCCCSCNTIWCWPVLVLSNSVHRAQQQQRQHHSYGAIYDAASHLYIYDARVIFGHRRVHRTVT